MRKCTLIQLAVLSSLFAATAAQAQTATVMPSPIVMDAACDLQRGSTIVARNVPNNPAAIAEAVAADLLARKASGSYWCVGRTPAQGTYTAAPPPPPPTCTTPQPAAESRTVQCPAGTTGTWAQSRTYAAAPAPTCWVAGAWTPDAAPAGACVPVPPPSPPPPGVGITYYFSDCQTGATAGCVPGNNANAGTQAAPKRDLTGINVNTLPAGSSLLFARGGSWNLSALLRLENMNTSAAAPLVFGNYGTGPIPLFRVTVPFAGIEVGGGWNNTTDDGGYTFRGIKFDGLGAGTQWGFWLRDNVKDVVFDGAEITGFEIGIHAQSAAPHGVRNFVIRGSTIRGNRGMGVLGAANSGFIVEDSLIEGNNVGGTPSGVGFSHGIYAGGDYLHTGAVFRRNVFRNNSISTSGLCGSGGLTLHGQYDGVLIEDNVFEQTGQPDQGCWQLSITAGYSAPEFFRNLVVRGNRIINGGNAGMSIQAAPGALIEGNISWSSSATVGQAAVNVGESEGATDDRGTGPTIRNNVACYTTPLPSSTVVRANVAGAVLSGNVMRTGADAATGPCAR